MTSPGGSARSGRERGMVIDRNGPPIVPTDEAPTEGPQPPASRFAAPTDSEAVRRMLAANERAERLAQRIVAAEHALKNGQSATVVLALLGGADDAE